MAEKVLGFKKKDAKYEQAVDGNMPEFAGDYIIDERKLVPVVSLEEFKKVKEERDDFLKVLRMDNKRGLKLEKDRHTSKVKLIDKAIELGLVEKEMYQGTEMLVGTLKGNSNEMVDTEWGELQDWVNRQRVINLKLGKDLLSAVKKPKEKSL